MLLSKIFLSSTKNTAHIAKSRLKYIFYKKNKKNFYPHYLNHLKKDLLYIIYKHTNIQQDINSITWNKNQSNSLVLKFEITIPNN